MPTTTAPATFAELWRRAAETHADRTFLVFRAEDGRVDPWTYAEFDAVVREAAGALATHGVGGGDAVHVCLRNCPAFIALWLATARLGAWIVPVDPASTTRDVENQLSRVRPRVGVLAADRAETYRAAVGDGDLPLVVLAETEEDVRPGGPLRPDGVEHPAPAAVRPEDRLAVMFTSGTTSQPKGVVLTQANYRHVAAGMAAAAGLRPDDRWLVTLPLFHANAQFYCFAPAIDVGASVALTATFSARRWVAWATELEATCASLFAAPIRMIIARTPEGTPPARLRHVWFAQSLGREHHREFGELAGVAPRQLYGMTETTVIVTADRSEPPSHELIGAPLPGRTVRLVDPESLDDVDPGTPGMMLLAGVRGDDLFSGYLDDPDVDARSFTVDDHGVTWFRTGDLAVGAGRGGGTDTGTDPEALRFVGRVDDVIKVAGENVSLTEVEATLAQAPGVLEVAVVAQADEVRDQVPVAYVVARDPERPPAPDDLAAWAAEQLAPQARPRAWHLLEALPRTSVGKIRRFKIGAGD